MLQNSAIIFMHKNLQRHKLTNNPPKIRRHWQMHIKYLRKTESLPQNFICQQLT